MSQDQYQRLIEDPEFKQAGETLNKLDSTVTNLLASRETTLINLRKLKRDVEESYDKSRKARIGGTTATVTGSVLAIVGFGLSFVTFGASLGLTIAGGILAASGGITICGAELGYLVVSKKDFQNAQSACDTDREMMKKAPKLSEGLDDNINSLSNVSIQDLRRSTF